MNNQQEKPEALEKSFDDTEEKPKKTNKQLSPDLLGRALRKLSVIDRLRSERVSPRWYKALELFGWIEQKKLDQYIVFEGANKEFYRFWDNRKLKGGSGNECYSISLLNRIGDNLTQFNIESFDAYDNNIEITTEFYFKIRDREHAYNIRYYRLEEFVDHLPATLRNLSVDSRTVSIGTLEALSNKCSNLEEVPFNSYPKEDEYRAIELIGKFPRQKRLELPLKSLHTGALASIGQLEELEELYCRYECLDEISLQGITNCERLKLFYLHTRHLNEQALFQLEKFNNLTVLQIYNGGDGFTDSVLMAIARRGQLKKFSIIDYRYAPLTDDSIVFLIERCKSLVLLLFIDGFGYPELMYQSQITQRSLEAVIREVHRRHGNPPRALPTDPLDNQIFYFRIDLLKEWIANGLEISPNPWLTTKPNYIFEERKLF